MESRNPALDGLRALAALSVLAFHCRVPGFNGGFIGVDVFFVLSGFLITNLLRRGSTKNFYLRRVKRLIPAFVTMLLAYAIAAPFLWPLRPVGEIVSDILGAATYLSNYLVKGGDWPLRHTWSLSIEMQFYLIWPLVVGSLPERKAPYVLGAAWLVMTIWRPIVYRFWGWDSAYYHLDTHATGLLVGAILTYVPKQSDRHIWQGLLLLAGLMVTLKQENIFAITLGIPFAELAATLVVVGARNGNANFLSSPLLSGLGLISYGIYLWHYPIALLVRPILPWWMSLPIVATFSITLAALSYFTVEAPFRKRRTTQPAPVA